MHKEFFKTIDWKLLREEKQELLHFAEANSDILYGIVHMIDDIQDYAVDVLKYDEKEVFG